MKMVENGIQTKKDKTEGIREHARLKQADTRNRALKAIRQMSRKGMKITIYGVSQMTGISRSFLTDDPVVRKEIDSYRRPKHENDSNPNTSIPSKKILQFEIIKLRKQVEKLQKYKELYTDLLEQNDLLKKQLKSIYTEMEKNSRPA